jgi:hypothetical protein
VAQATRVLRTLVSLGIVERREAPPSVLFRFEPENVAARAVAALADSEQAVLEELRHMAGGLEPRPMSVIVFGSFARGDAVAESDLDVGVVGGNAVAEDDAARRSALTQWSERVRGSPGNAPRSSRSTSARRRDWRGAGSPACST